MRRRDAAPRRIPSRVEAPLHSSHPIRKPLQQESKIPVPLVAAQSRFLCVPMPDPQIHATCKVQSTACVHPHLSALIPLSFSSRRTPVHSQLCQMLVGTSLGLVSAPLLPAGHAPRTVVTENLLLNFTSTSLNETYWHVQIINHLFCYKQPWNFRLFNLLHCFCIKTKAIWHYTRIFSKRMGT